MGADVVDVDVMTAEPLPGIRTRPPPWPKENFCAAWALDFQAPGVPRVTMLQTLASQPSAPTPDELILWFGAPSETASLEEALAMLDPTLRRRAAQFRFAADRACFVAAHAGLRTILAPMLGCTPEHVTCVRDPHGKPYLCAERHGPAAAAIHFNISHARGCVAVAVAGRPVGVDVEVVRPTTDLDRIATGVFAPDVQAALRDAPNDRRLGLFYRHWTLGEAFIKATGLGLSQGLASFAFNSEGIPRLVQATSRWGPADRWRFGLLG